MSENIQQLLIDHPSKRDDTENASKHDGWYTFIWCGTEPIPARGPHRTLEDAQTAIWNFYARHGASAGTYWNVGSVTMVKCRTRADARRVMIDDRVEFEIVH